MLYSQIFVLAADESVVLDFLETTEGNLRLSEAQVDPRVFVKLADEYIIQILQSSSSEEVKNIVKRIQNEDYYQVRERVNLSQLCIIPLFIQNLETFFYIC